MCVVDDDIYIVLTSILGENIDGFITETTSSNVAMISLCSRIVVFGSYIDENVNANMVDTRVVLAGQTDKAVRKTDIQTNRQTDRQTDRQSPHTVWAGLVHHWDLTCLDTTLLFLSNRYLNGC
jgi:hypothetical protein